MISVTPKSVIFNPLSTTANTMIGFAWMAAEGGTLIGLELCDN